MDEVSGTYLDGRVVLDSQVNWPDGARVAVVPQSETIGMREEDWPTDAAGIQRLVEEIGAFEPLEMTPEEEREWMEAREAVKQVTLEAVRKQMGLSS